MLSSSDSSVFRRDFFYMITCNKCLAYSGVLQMCTCLWPGGRTAAHLAGFQTVSVVLFSCAWSVARSVKHQLPDARERARTSNTISMLFGALLRKGCLSCIIGVCVFGGLCSFLQSHLSVCQPQATSANKAAADLSASATFSLRRQCVSLIFFA